MNIVQINNLVRVVVVVCGCGWHVVDKAHLKADQAWLAHMCSTFDQKSCLPFFNGKLKKTKKTEKKGKHTRTITKIYFKNRKHTAMSNSIDSLLFCKIATDFSENLGCKPPTHGEFLSSLDLWQTEPIKNCWTWKNLKIFTADLHGTVGIVRSNCEGIPCRPFLGRNQNHRCDM